MMEQVDSWQGLHLVMEKKLAECFYTKVGIVVAFIFVRNICLHFIFICSFSAILLSNMNWFLRWFLKLVFNIRIQNCVRYGRELLTSGFKFISSHVIILCVINVGFLKGEGYLLYLSRNKLHKLLHNYH